MSPHALPDDGGNVECYSRATNKPQTANGDGLLARRSPKISLLERYDNDQLHDLVCVGFGPASLAIAVALQDALDGTDAALSTQKPKVRFLERQDQFAWHAGMLIPGAKMQITFIKDLATLRNPRSEFTFLNYLHRQGRLVAFTNLSTFLPQRIEYEDYMRWCAGCFDHVVDYGQDVSNIEADARNSRTGAIETFRVTAKQSVTGETLTIKTKHVIIATGGKPKIPKCLSAPHPRVIHSSQYASRICEIFPNGSRPKRIAVVGGGQSAAEVFSNVPSRFPGTQSILLIRGAALRPSDDSPFVNELFNPERVDDIYLQDPQIRANSIALNRSTNYGVVRLELLEDIYSRMYSYRVQQRAEQDWPLRILSHRIVTGMADYDLDGQPGVQLYLQNDSGDHYAHSKSCIETLTVDLVVVASGYVRNAHEDMLSSLRECMLGGDADDKRWSVHRDYKVKFEPGAVENDAGVWLQGCNESTHGLADSLLSILAVRGGEMVDSIFRTRNTGIE